MSPGRIFSYFNFKGLYIAFVIAVVFYGQVRMIFGLTPRHIAMVAMLIACMSQGVPFPMGRIIKTYLVFVFSFLVSATVTGYLDRVLITYYIAACVGYWATKILITKYKDGKLLLNVIVVLGVLNAIVTIGQTFGLQLSDQLVSFFNLELPEKYLAKLNEEGGGDMALLLTRPGLFNSPVYNGYFLMTTGVASLFLLTHNFSLWRLFPWVINLGGCICVQERGPIIILTVLSAFAFYKVLFIKRNAYILLMIIFGLLVYFITGSITSILPEQGMDSPVRRTVSTLYEDDESYSDYQNDFSNFMKESRFAEVGLKDTGRDDIYSQATDYLMDHPFIGGYHRFAHIYKMAPHNLFLNAFIYGGIVGGFAILLILFWQIKPLWRVLRRKIADTNPICFFAGLSYLAFTLNSLVHNRSLVTGDEFLWMLWAAFYYEYQKYYMTPR